MPREIVTVQLGTMRKSEYESALACTDIHLTIPSGKWGLSIGSDFVPNMELTRRASSRNGPQRVVTEKTCSSIRLTTNTIFLVPSLSI
jgi:hypothetical protein